MVDVIEIEGDIVRHIQRTVVTETTLALAAPHLEVRAPSIFPVLPRGTVLAGFDPDERRGAVLIERPPERLNLNVHFDQGLTQHTPGEDYNRTTRRRGNFNLQFPYLYFLYGFRLGTGNVGEHIRITDFAIDRSYLFMRREAIKTPQDPLWNARIMNVKEARICWGYTEHDNDSLSVRINHMVNEFPVTVFNNHYGVPLPDDYQSMTQWEAASEDPLCYRAWRHWQRTPEQPTAEKLLQESMSAMNAATNPYEGLPAADDRFTDVLIPDPPVTFTIGRLREWFNTLPPALKGHFLREAAAAAAEEVAATTPAPRRRRRTT